MGVFGSFSKAKQTIEEAKKDVRRPRDEVSQQRAKKAGQQQGGGKR